MLPKVRKGEEPREMREFQEDAEELHEDMQSFPALTHNFSPTNSITGWLNSFSQDFYMTPRIPAHQPDTSESLWAQFESWACSKDSWLNQNANTIIYPVIDYGTGGLAPTLLEASGIETQVNHSSGYVQAY